ncbi:hypothetical protein MRQ36_19840 [Micromonospora sp. R77]|uniref:endonuclease/exonuclease/phosphatase family protein n=1 Tax=Micromonospora sp. R77 TaxID=2925836 RepID=UPI001F6040C5|nr:hypothetical protein [Micromonospora sp. R77]MCI4064698.1 hypothetical protein [Micromonospora sp. R77]
MLLFAVGAVAYYAAYDLGYPNGWVPVGAALFVALAAVRGAENVALPAVGGPEKAVPAPARDWLVVSVVLVTGATGWLHRPAVPPPGDGPPPSVRVVAYNIRMGFGLDGRLDLAGLHRALTRTRPDVVVLSEVDRGWLLNGGHDTLALLAGRRLRMRYVFASPPTRSGATRCSAAGPSGTGRTWPLPRSAAHRAQASA